MPAPTRFVLWALAFAIDLGTPWAAVQHTVRPVHADSSWRVCRGRVAGYGKPGRLDAGRGRPLYLGIVVLGVGIHRVVMGGHAIRRFRSVNGRSCRQQSVPLPRDGHYRHQYSRCVQEAEDGTARILLQTLTLPSEDADILK